MKFKKIMKKNSKCGRDIQKSRNRVSQLCLNFINFLVWVQRENDTFFLPKHWTGRKQGMETCELQICNHSAGSCTQIVDRSPANIINTAIETVFAETYVYMFCFYF